MKNKNKYKVSFEISCDEDIEELIHGEIRSMVMNLTVETEMTMFENIEVKEVINETKNK